MSQKVALLYVPGLGDKDTRSRQFAIKLGLYHRFDTEIFTMDWSLDEPWPNKLKRLTDRVQALAAQGSKVVLVGESAGASAVTQVLADRPLSVAGVVLLCGKSQYPDKLGDSYRQNYPALYDSVAASHIAINSLTTNQKAKILNLHPIFDPVVPVAETKIPGVKNALIPMVGHPTSIFFAVSIWSFRIKRFASKTAIIN